MIQKAASAAFFLTCHTYYSMSKTYEWDLESDLDQVTRLAVYHTMIKLYRLGINETRLGKLMRMIGIDDETSCHYDDQIVTFDIEIVKYIESIIGVEKQLHCVT